MAIKKQKQRQKQKQKQSVVINIGEKAKPKKRKKRAPKGGGAPPPPAVTRRMAVPAQQQLQFVYPPFVQQGQAPIRLNDNSTQLQNVLAPINPLNPNMAGAAAIQRDNIRVLSGAPQPRPEPVISRAASAPSLSAQMSRQSSFGEATEMPVMEAPPPPPKTPKLTKSGVPRKQTVRRTQAEMAAAKQLDAEESAELLISRGESSLGTSAFTQPSLNYATSYRGSPAYSSTPFGLGTSTPSDADTVLGTLMMGASMGAETAPMIVSRPAPVARARKQTKKQSLDIEPDSDDDE